MRAGANSSTTSMLLDTFMNGFLHRLFCQKWYLYGRRLFLLRRGLDLVLIVMLLYLSFDLKTEPVVVSRHMWVAIWTMVIIAVQIMYEATTAVLFTINEQQTSEEHLSLWTLLKLTASWARMHEVPTIMAAHTFTVAACGMVVAADLPMIASCDNDLMGFNDTARRLVARKTPTTGESTVDDVPLDGCISLDEGYEEGI